MKRTPGILTAGIVALAAAVAMTVGGISRSDGGDKHQELLKYRQSRDILSFEEILKAVRPKIEGEIIEAEFEEEGGIPVYEFKYIDASGRVLKIYTDARTGEIIKRDDD